MGAFEDFVNKELPLRISTLEDGGGTGNLPEGLLLLTTGIGLSVITGYPTKSIVLISTNSNIGGTRIIAIKNNYAVYADHTDLDTIGLGISMQAVVAGVNVPVQRTGIISISGVVWTSGLPVYISTNGLFTQIAPNSGYVQQIGIAYSSDQLLIDIAQRIILT